MDTLIFRTQYHFKKIIKDSIIEYNYFDETDFSRNMTLSYNLNSEILFFDLSTEYKIDKTEVISNSNGIWFDSYKMTEPKIDGVEPIIFKKYYGILAITGALNPSAFIVSTKNDISFIKQIEMNLYN
tara:strand:+ start:3056 stop:3436 length:381 start_codon:yes stop_codon:yes gene_type:complete